jgi:hypothetical protein
MEAQRQFDVEYQIVRRLLVQGKTDAKTVKGWLKKHGIETATSLQLEVRDLIHRQAGQRVDREVDRIKAYETKEYGDLKDDE